LMIHNIVFHSSCYRNTAQWFQFLHVLANTCYFLESVLVVVILLSVSWYPIVVLGSFAVPSD
jgi:hypothetical protein